ncbi:MAG TPA: HU family DNA-binding protein [Roseateles sp.]|nr:HU family DNA-binding protein [Roseateles sp.]
MNKQDMIERVAREADISTAAATRAVDALLGGIHKTLKKGGSVSLVGFGTFSVLKRKARAGRNPRTGEAIEIKARKVPKWTPGQVMKDDIA